MRLRRAAKTGDRPIAVGELLTDDGQPSTVVVAGLLHDVLEDTDVTPAKLHTRFGPDVARPVEALTQDTAIVKHGERKAALRRQIVDADPEAAIVSLADKNREVAGRGAATDGTSDGALPGDARWDRGALRPQRTITRAARALAREITASALASRRPRSEHGRQLCLDAELIGPSARLYARSGYFSMSRAADVQAWVTSRMNFA